MAQLRESFTLVGHPKEGIGFIVMTQEKFDALVKRLEDLARKQPATYKLRVGLLAVLGYAYIFLILAGLLAAFGVIVLIMVNSRRMHTALIKLGIVVLVPTFIILKSLWVHFPAPTGLALSRKEVPRLFAFVDELTSSLQAPRFHHILLVNEFNAAVVQRPRLGIFGWQENYLLVGLPLMQALSPEQFRAVLAHELGHLSGNHSRFSGWIYRVQKTYFQMLERLEQGGQDGSSILFERFFNWYAPFFSAYSFVLRRMNEYEADRCAMQLAGAQNTAEALINVEVKARFLDSAFWPSVYQQVTHLVEPPAATFTTMFQKLGTGVTPEDGSRWFEQAIAEKTDNADTHPCLADRLSALGYVLNEGQLLSLPAPMKVSAAQECLGDALTGLTTYFDRTWQEEVATPWRQRYAYAQEAQKNLQALEEKAQNQPLTAEEAWNRACWTAELKGNEEAIALFQDIVMSEPNDAAANYALGQILLQQKDPIGIGYIEKAIALNPDQVISGCELIYAFLKQQGQIEAANVYQKRAQNHYELVLRARQERATISHTDEFQSHGLPADAVQQLGKQLSGYEQIKEAYLVRKVVNYFPEKPFYVLGVKRHYPWHKLNLADLDTELLDKLVSEIQLPGQAYFLILNNQHGYNQKIGKIIGKIEGAPIYRR